MILIDKHGNKLIITEHCPKCGSFTLMAEEEVEVSGVECWHCLWAGPFWDLTAFVEELPIERVS